MVSRYSSGRSADGIVTVFVLAYALCFGVGHLNGAEQPGQMLTLVDRVVIQDQGAWVIDYRLRNASHGGVIVTHDEIMLKVEGWVSNSRVASHALPRWSLVIVMRVLIPRRSLM